MKDRSKTMFRKVLMRVIFCVIVPVLVVVGVWFGLSLQNEARSAGWQEVAIEGFHTFRIPGYWILMENEGFLYFADREINQENSFEDITVFMIGNGSFLQSLERVYDNVTYLERVRGFALDGSGAHYGVDIYNIDNERVEKFWIGLERSTGEGRRTLGFISIDDSVTEDTVRTIAFSYGGSTRILLETIAASIFFVTIYFAILSIVFIIRRVKKKRL